MDSVNVHIIVTTINEPTEALLAWTRISDCRLIAVGDRKTPDDWNCPGCRFFSFEEQQDSDFQLGHDLPGDHYSRKMLGYLLALSKGAEHIFDTDDDNEPFVDAWRNGPPRPRSGDTVTMTDSELGFVNPYSFYGTGTGKVWPRGLPLERVDDPQANLSGLWNQDADERTSNDVAIWQGLVDADPDVDAIHRLVFGTGVTFKDRGPLVLGRGTYAPFNSQNTLWSDSTVFPLLYLPTTVTFRYTDILRSYVALPILEKMERSLGFLGPTARQDRNDHDLMTDFESEIPMYRTANWVVDDLKSVVSSNIPVTENLVACYKRLEETGITTKAELPRVRAWLTDLKELGHCS
jgi:hypothetical protein